MDSLRFKSQWGYRILFFSKLSILSTLRSIQPPINGYRGSFLKAMQPGCNADHSPLSTTQVKNELGYTSAPPRCLHGMGNYNFTMYVSH